MQQGGELNFEQYCYYMQERGQQLTQDELQQRYNELNGEYKVAEYNSYDDYARSNVGVDSLYAEQKSLTRRGKGGAYDFHAQQNRQLTPLVEFLRWQEWYVQYCQLRNIGQSPYR